MFSSPIASFILRSLFAGFLIGFGCIIYVASENHYIGSFLFAIGLLTILVKDYLLYTSRVGCWTLSNTPILLAMFILNAVGTAIVAYLFSLTRMDLSAIEQIAYAKLNDNYFSIFILAIGCGVMMHIAAYCFKKEHHPIYVIMPIMFFILAGFEHSVANSGFYTLAGSGFNLDILTRFIVVVVGNGIGNLVFSRILKVENDIPQKLY